MRRYFTSKAQKPQQGGRKGEITFRFKPHICQRFSESSNLPCAHQDPETPQRLRQNCFSISCGGNGQQRTTGGTRALGAADVGTAQALLEEVAIDPTIKPPELTQDWETSSWWAQTEPCTHQDPGERSSDPTRD